MSEPAPDLAARQSLRHWLLSLQPPIAVFAQDLLGEAARLDLVARDEHGRVVLVLVDARLRDLPDSLEDPPDTGLLTSALRELDWVQARLRDWDQLAPGLSLASDRAVQAWLVAPGFDSGTRAAARALGERIRLVEARPAGMPLRIRFAGEAVERPDPPAAGPATPAARHGSAPGPPDGDGAVPPVESDDLAGVFRSGLSEADLRLSAAERDEFADS